jgi:RNA recognition motif-containing protein
MKIYVGNLPFTATEDEVRQLFEAHGTVTSVSLISDRETGRPRGFGFVEMSDEDGASAVSALDGQNFGGRTLRINEARPRREGGGGGGGGGGRGRGGGGGGWGGGGDRGGDRGWGGGGGGWGGRD